MSSFVNVSSFLLVTACFLLVWIGQAPATVQAESSNCVEEFGQCVTNRDCCGRDEYGDKILECVTGDWEVTTDSTCLSKRSQELDALSKEHGFDHQTLTVLLKDHIYQHPEIREQLAKRSPDKAIDQTFCEKVAKKYRHEFPKLVASLERKYKITDTSVLPTLIRQFVVWKDSVDIAEVYARGGSETDDRSASSKTEF